MYFLFQFITENNRNFLKGLLFMYLPLAHKKIIKIFKKDYKLFFILFYNYVVTTMGEGGFKFLFF